MSAEDITKDLSLNKITSVEAILNQESGYESDYEEFYKVVVQGLEERGACCRREFSEA